MKAIFPVLLLGLVSIAGDASQTDWSGGEYGGGTVLSWESCFSWEDDISWSAIPGQATLSSLPVSPCVEYIVDPSIPMAGMAAGDVNGDGMTDIAGASLVSGHVWLFIAQPGGGWASEQLPGSFEGALGCSFFDMDIDGHLDLIGSTAQPDRIVFWKNEAGTGEFGDPVVIAESFPGVHCAVGCHVDQDEFPDLLAAGNECSQIAVWYGLGNDQWEKVLIDSTFTGTQSVSPGDFDGDGDTDAVGAALELGEFAWWENPGTRYGQWTKHTVSSAMPGAHFVQAVDMDADGLTDVLGASFSNGRITWWENDGSVPPVWEPHTVAPGLTGALTSVAGDFDGDNDLDVAGSSWVMDRIVWYENLDGTGESWQVRNVCTGFNGAWPVICGDFDGNGRLDIAAGADVLSGSGPSHGPSVFDVCGFNDHGWLESCVLDTQEYPQWSSFQFDAEVPAGCGLSFYWRSSDDPADLGEWSAPYSSWSELSGLVHRYVQYKVEMSGNGDCAPLIRELELFWDPEGVEGDTGSDLLFVPADSPCGSLSIVIEKGIEPVTVSLFSVSGRRSAGVQGLLAGETAQFTELPPGIYLLQAESGGRRQIQKLCILPR